MDATPAHAVSACAVAESLDTDVDRGLAREDAALRLARDGPNRLRRTPRPPYARLALRQFADPLVALLIVATVISLAVGEGAEAAVIAAVLLLNGVLGFWQELRAEQAIRALSGAFTQEATLVRGGVELRMPADGVVVGDVILVEEGERIAADARVAAARGLEVDESALTGESLPVAKQVDPVGVHVPLGDRASMLYAGTGVTRGRGRAIVSATGFRTEIGQIQDLASRAKPPPTPLQRRLGRLAGQMVVAGVALTLFLTFAMLLHGADAHEAFLVGVAVAVAAVPEGLAATVTAALALGARAMARRAAVIRRLDAIETLGRVTVVCTDKTGTLTENRIQVAAMRPARVGCERELLSGAVLASAARFADGKVWGDPIEVALVEAAIERGLSPDQLLTGRELVHELPFDSERKRATYVYADAEGLQAFGKGAPEVLDRTDGELAEAASVWAEEGFRVLAVVSGRLPRDTSPDGVEEHALELLGVIAFHDPLRSTAAEAVATAKSAGISVRMITGDHAATARTIGRGLGIDDDSIVARATPAEKLALVERLQEAGEIVAVTGDGVNDAPALRRADAGVAMGRGGTEAAREAAAVVLTDDDFATLVAAIAEGRRIGDNIRKFVAFLLSANLGEVLVFAVAVVAGLGAPLAVVQILIVNLLTDGAPALALAQDPPGAETMTTPPRGGERLFDRRTWSLLALVGLLVGAVTLAAYGAGLADGSATGRTMAFATLAFAELALVFGLRSPTLAAWQAPTNPWLVASVLASVALVTLALFAPFARTAVATASLSPWQLVAVLALSTLPIAVVESWKAVNRRDTRPGGPAFVRVRPVSASSTRQDTGRASTTRTECRQSRSTSAGVISTAGTSLR